MLLARPRLQLTLWQQSQPAYFGQLHECLLAAGGHACLALLRERAVHRYFRRLVADGEQCVERAVPSVGDGQMHHVGTRGRTGDSVAQRLARVGGGD